MSALVAGILLAALAPAPSGQLVALARAGGAGCLTAPAFAEQTRVTLARCAPGSAAQAWLVESRGAVSIQGLCLNAFGGAGRVGDAVGLYRCGADPNERWTLAADGTLRGMNGLCLAADGDAPGARYALQACTSPRTARFTPRPVALAAPASSVAAATPTLPAELHVPDDTAAVFRGGVVRRVPAPGGVVAPEALASALRAARGGDVILLPRGSRVPNMWLPEREAPGYVTIATDLPDAVRPAPGTRMTPALAASLQLARLVGGQRNDPVVRLAQGRGWRLRDLEITMMDPSVAALNTLVGLGYERDAAKRLPRAVILDRVYLHASDVPGRAPGDLTRCVLAHADSLAIVNSTLYCHGKFADAQAVGASESGWHLYENDSVAGSGHGFLFGGNDAPDALAPHDVVLRGNRIWKDTAWIGTFSAKSLFEAKNLRRALVEGNVFEQHWVDAQTGYAILLKSTNQSGTRDTVWTRDLTIRRNWLRAVAAGFNLAANPEMPEVKPARPMARVAITDNLLTDVRPVGRTPERGILVQMTGALRDVTLARNTMVHAAAPAGVGALSLEVKGAERLVVADNLMTAGGHGWNSPVGQGAAAFTGASVRATGNVLVGLAPIEIWRYPPGTTLVPDLAALGLTRGFALPAGSPFAGRGADVSAVLAATAHARGLR